MDTFTFMIAILLMMIAVQFNQNWLIFAIVALMVLTMRDLATTVMLIIATVVLAFSTWRYTKATKQMASVAEKTLRLNSLIFFESFDHLVLIRLQNGDNRLIFYREIYPNYFRGVG